MSIEAEQSVLGAVLLDRDCAMQAVDALAPEMFTSPVNREIFATVLDWYWRGEAIDSVTLIQSHPQHRGYLLELAQLVPTLSHMAEYIRIVQADWQLAELENELFQLSQGHGGIKEILDRLEELAQKHRGLLDAAGEDGITPFGQAFREFQEWLGQQGGDTAKTGYAGLDAATGGLMPGTVFTLAARPGSGKTDLAINIAQRMAKRGKKVLYFTMEMTNLQLMQRVASHLLGINSVLIRDKALSDKKLQQVESLTESIRQWEKLSFVQEPRVSVQRVRHFVDLWKPDVVVIDHIGLMERPNVRDPYKALGMVSNQLKQLALDKSVAVLQLAQMNRQMEGRKSPEPILSDLRESGDLEQDSAFVAFLVPEDLSKAPPLSGQDSAQAVLYLKKNRHGRLGAFPYNWRPQHHVFMEAKA